MRQPIATNNVELEQVPWVTTDCSRRFGCLLIRKLQSLKADILSTRLQVSYSSEIIFS